VCKYFLKKFKFEDENAGCAPNFRMVALNAIVSTCKEECANLKRTGEILWTNIE
jgi:hypothetical protein